MRRWAPLIALVLLGCPPAGAPDAAVELDARTLRPDAGLPDAGWTAVKAGEWCGALSQARCARDLRCGSSSADAGSNDCLARRAASCDQAAFTAAFDGQRARLVEPQALRCLNDFARGACSGEPPSCAGVWVGLVPPDGGCVAAAECAATGFCALFDQRCPHRCQRYAPLGSPCDGFTHLCDPAQASCDFGDAGEAVCLPRRTAGDPCVSFTGCGPSLSCAEGVCTPRTAAATEPCGLRSGYPFCEGDLFCRRGPPVGGASPPGTCQVRAGLGSTCVGEGSCLPSLRCSTLISTGVCLVKAHLAEPCIAPDDCEDGLFCDQRTQACARWPGAGGDCSFRGSGYRCAPGFQCLSDSAGTTCVALRANGESCSYSSLCASNECSFGPLVDGGFGGRCIASCSQRADGGF